MVARDELAECRIPIPDRPGVLAEVTTVLGELGVNIWDLEIAHPGDARGELVIAIDANLAGRVQLGLEVRDYHPVFRRRR